MGNWRNLFPCVPFSCEEDGFFPFSILAFVVIFFTYFLTVGHNMAFLLAVHAVKNRKCITRSFMLYYSLPTKTACASAWGIEEPTTQTIHLSMKTGPTVMVMDLLL